MAMPSFYTAVLLVMQLGTANTYSQTGQKWPLAQALK